MSATGRGSDREASDGYYTPLPCALAICQRLLADKVVAAGCSVLEPSIGKGAFAASASQVLEPSVLAGVDLVRQDSIEVLGLDTFVEGDFLKYEPDEYWDVVLGNPPYGDAEAHVRHALNMIDPDNGVLAFLLRLNFLEGKERVRGLWKDHPPSAIYVLNRRPSFKTTKKPKIDPKTGEIVLSKRTGKPIMVTSSNDACAYGVFCWLAAAQKPVVPALRWLEW